MCYLPARLERKLHEGKTRSVDHSCILSSQHRAWLIVGAQLGLLNEWKVLSRQVENVCMEFLNLLANFAPPIRQQGAELCLTDPPLCREGFSEKDILKLFQVRGT